MNIRKTSGSVQHEEEWSARTEGTAEHKDEEDKFNLKKMK
jgi:hypothetical protein